MGLRRDGGQKQDGSTTLGLSEFKAKILETFYSSGEHPHITAVSLRSRL